MVYVSYVIIPHPQTEAILVCKDHQLPRIYHNEVCTGSTDVSKLCSKAEALLGNSCRLFLLRAECESTERSADLFDTEAHMRLFVFEIVSVHNFEKPPGFAWVNRHEVSRLIVEPHMADVQGFLQRYKKHGLRQTNVCVYPYSVQGWFTEASAWICNEGARQGLNILEIEQVNRKAEGCVLTALTHHGSRVFFKEVGPNAGLNELRATEVLSETMPNWFPSLLGVKRDRNWMLLQDQGRTIDEKGISVSKNPSLFRVVLTEWGYIQRSSVSRISELQSKGLEMVDESFLRARVGNMMSDVEWLSICLKEMKEADSDLVVDVCTLKTTFLNYVGRACGLMSKFQMPLTLVHGDLNPVNIIVCQQRQIRLIDLGSTCISYPFRDAYLFTANCDADDKDLGFYLQIWKDYGTMEELSELYDLTVGFEMVVSCVAFHRWYRSTEKSRKSVRQQASQAFGFFAAQLFEFPELRGANETSKEPAIVASAKLVGQ